MSKIALNWTLEVIVGCISVIPVGIAFLLTCYYYFKEKNRSLLFMTLSWFCLTIWILVETLSYLYLDKSLFRAHNFFLIPLGFFIALLADSIDKESIEPTKIALFTALSASVFIFSLDPDLVIPDSFPNGDSTLALAGELRIAVSTLAFLTGCTIAYYMAKIHLNAPKNLRFYSGLNLVGAIMTGILSSILVAVGISMIIPGSALAIISCGALLMSIAFVAQPKLAFVLPFKATSLTVIEANSGIPLFTHSWSKKEDLIDESVFSGMLSGITSFVDIALGKGNIREIHLDQAILILERHEKSPVAYVLVATKSSPSLRNALNSFAEKFSKKFLHDLSTDVVDTEEYEAASELVLSCFPFVPEYD